MIVTPANKKKLPRGAVKWLKEHYADTPNAEIMKRYGISKTVLSRLKREYRLKKSEEYMRKARKKGFETIRAMGWPPKGYAIPNREKAWATLAERTKNRGEEWKGKISRTMSKQWKDEKRRVLFGLEQKTKRKVTKAPNFKRELRYRMRWLGYIIPRGGNIAYWNEDTNRNERKEKTAMKYGIELQPMEEQ